MIDLFETQRAKIDKFKTLRVGADFSEPGTGKTRSTLEVVKSTDADALFWIAPYGAINPPNGFPGIKEEVLKWGCGERPIYFYAPESISASSRIYLNIRDEVSSFKSPFIVVDESLKIKNYNALRTKRMLELSTLVKYKFILNGTALSRCMLDLWSQFEFLAPEIINMSYAEYKATFCEYTTVKKRFGNTWRSREFVTAYHNIDFLYSIIYPYVYGSKLNLDVTKQYLNLEYTLSYTDMQKYKYLKNKYLDDETLAWRNNNIFLEMTQHMQHEYCTTEDKFDTLDNYLKGVDRSKVLIYRKFVESETELKKRYPDIPVFSVQSNSQSLNLQEYNIIVKWDKTWDYGLVDQLPYRIFRYGQANDCTIVDMTGNVNLENLMQQNNDKKGKLLEYFKSIGSKKMLEML